MRAVPALALALALGCVPEARTARDVARGGLLLLVQAAEAGDVACATYALAAKGSKDIAKLEKAKAAASTCANAKARVLDAAEVGAGALETWDSAAQGNLACAAVRGLLSLSDLATTIQALGGKVPDKLTDGLAMASRLASGATDCKDK